MFSRGMTPLHARCFLFVTALATASEGGKSCLEGTSMLHRSGFNGNVVDTVGASSADFVDFDEVGSGAREFVSQNQVKDIFDKHIKRLDIDDIKMTNNIDNACKDKRVVVSGMPRSGSTSLYVIGQIFLFFCNKAFRPDRQTFYIDFPEDCSVNASKTSTYCSKNLLSTPIGIVKTHTAVDDFRRGYGDVVLFSHRKPDDAMASIWLSFHDAANCRHPPCGGWPTLQKEMGRQACLYAHYPSHRIGYDMALEDLQNKPDHVFHAVASALGVTLDGTSAGKVPKGLVSIAMEIYNEAKSFLQHGDQVSHNSHNQTELVALARSQVAGTAGVAWVDSAGAFESNPFVHISVPLTDAASEIQHQSVSLTSEARRDLSYDWWWCK